jgi:hypothetical protein
MKVEPTFTVNFALNNTNFEALLADKAFDGDALRKYLSDRGVEAVLPSNSFRSAAITFDEHAYMWRHLVETVSVK